VKTDRRRPLLLVALATMASALSAQPLSDPYAPAPVPLLVADDAPLLLEHSTPAGGPLERHTARPGAWYGAVFVSMLTRWPVELWIWQRTRSHQLRVFALDGWPAAAASVVVALPLRNETTARGRPLIHSAPFVLPAATRADGMFLLIEQWSLAGDRPHPVWLQARVGATWSQPGAARGDSPWWAAREEAGPPSQPIPGAPPGALLAPRSSGGVIEIPILKLTTPMPRPVPQFEPWWER
jgi:hypothetical protein